MTGDGQALVIIGACLMLVTAVLGALFVTLVLQALGLV